MALWRTRALPPDQKEQIVEEQLEKDEKLAMSEDTSSYLVVEDVQMSKVYSAELPVNVSFSMFNIGGVTSMLRFSRSSLLLSVKI